MKKEVIDVSNVTFSYDGKVDVLKDVSLKIYENEYVCIIGHNGSGKSTLSKILMGLLKPSRGTIKLFGEVLTKSNVDHLRNNVGVIFQNPDSQFIGITAEDDIAFGLENRNVPREKMKDIIYEAARKVESENLIKQESQRLSGGQKQRVAIASVLAINPDIMIFDESTSMLDPKGKIELKEMIINLQKIHNKTIISITHDMEEVINATKVIVMNKGEIVKVGTPHEIFKNDELLHDIHLDIPFTMKLSKLISNKNKKIKETLNQKELINSICQIIK